MILDKPKKYKGIKFLKVDQQSFNNAKKFNRKSSYNSNSINNKSSSNDNNGKLFLKSSLNCNHLITDGEKTPSINKNNIKKNLKRLNSCKKKDFKKFNEIAISKFIKKKEEEKNDKEMLLNKFGKANLKPLIYKKSVSCRKLFNQPFMNNIINSNNINNNINNDTNNIYKYKSDNNANKKIRINYNDKNSKENNSNNKKINLNTINTKKEMGNENREKQCKIKKLKNWFCCF